MTGEGAMGVYSERVLYYNMDGKQISLDEAGKLFADPASRRVAFDKLPNGYDVSTVCLVIDHSFAFGGRPMIFETMVFGPDSEDMERYSTKAEALEGHQRMVEKWRSK